MIDKTAKVWLGGRKGVTAPIHVSQYDTGWRFLLSVYDGDAVYTGDESTAVYMEGRKADGTVFAVPGAFADGVAVVECAASITAAVGPIDCELRVSEDGETVGTANFEIIVEAAPLKGYVASGDDFSAMQQVLDGSSEAAADAIAAKSAAAASAEAAAVSAATAQVQAGMAYQIAASAADMTDHSIGYVYVGNETGYTYGGWYYWDGTAWTLGGLSVDPTGTVAGAAMEAKAAGAAIGDLKSAILSKYTGATPASVADLPGNSWWVANGSVLAPIIGNSFTWTLDTSKSYYVRVYQLSNTLRRFEISSTGGITYWAGWKTNATPNITWSTVLPDSTLKISGVPADSKVVGDNILVKYTGAVPSISITELPDNCWWLTTGGTLVQLLGDNFIWTDDIQSASSYVVNVFRVSSSLRRFEVCGAGGFIHWVGYILSSQTEINWKTDFPDTTLSAPEVPADAKTTGDYIYSLIESLEPIFIKKTTKTVAGIHFEWQSDGSCKIWGTATSTAINNIVEWSDIPSTIKLPSQPAGEPKLITPGDTLEFNYNTTNPNVWISVGWSDGGSPAVIKYENIKNGWGLSTIPLNKTRWGVRLYINNGVTIPEETPAVVSNIRIRKFSTDVITGGGTLNAKMLGFGHSDTTGAVWVLNSSNVPHKDHLCPYDDAPYAGIASGLGVRQENVEYRLISDTGFMYAADPNEGSFLDNIKAKGADIKNYDYVLVQLATSDMRHFAVGSLENSVADDGSIIGGLLGLISFIKTNNSLCQPVVIGPIPSAGPSTLQGDGVFDHKYTYAGVGTSIRELDTIIKELAEREHFKFVSFEDMELSYRWQDFTCNGDNVHLASDGAYRIVGEYLRRKVAGA